ncbi:ATP-binding protein [Polaromonas jejuensis]|uniref:histidine kinase n=1 Tax=Polaromonas jejuensis TaxID=457502 RepID=A0ABW0Q8L3_9BURK|nr:ATP-binding protein [Polaromonas jejuensis]
MAAALAILAAMVIAWLVMGWLFARHIEHRVASELENDAVVLLSELTLSANGTPQVDDTPPDPRFERPASGLYWQLSTSAGALRSRSLWDQSLPSGLNASSGNWVARGAEGPFDQKLLLLERTVIPTPGGFPVLVQLAHDKALLNVARDEFGRELALFLGILWLVLLAAAGWQVRTGLAPLARLRDELVTMRRHPATRLARGHPREVLPLVEAINQLADSREGDLSRARRRAADLAHSLKTPLAALDAQSRRARDAGAADAADGVDRAAAAMAAAVEAELGRLRAASARAVDYHYEASPRDAAEKIVGVVEHTSAGESLVFEVDIPDELRVPLRADDAKELLGALIENAARFARRRVRIQGRALGAGVAIVIEDDGAGLDAATLQALQAGGKLDEAGPGHHGLGLVIARELVEATGGEMRLERASLSGLSVTLVWV